MILRISVLIAILGIAVLAISTRPQPEAQADTQTAQGQAMSPQAQATRDAPPDVSYRGAPMSDKPSPHFDYAKLYVATPSSPLNLPARTKPLGPPGAQLQGGYLVPPPSDPLPTRMRTDGEITAVVNQELAKARQRGQARIRYQGSPPADFYTRYQISVRDPANTVVTVVECDCDATAMLPHSENVKWLIWVINRQHGSELMATEGSPMIQELLNDYTIPLPAFERASKEAGFPITPRGAPQHTPVTPVPPFSQR